MLENVGMRDFDVENHVVFAITNLDTEEIIGLVFQRPESAVSTVVTVQKSETVPSIDLFACAERVVERKIAKGNAS